MMRALWLFAFLAAAGALLLPPSEASAQWNNAPYQPSFRGAAGGVGMSPGYRQVMILDRLNSNISRNNYYRTPDGFLADITRRDGQAFPMSPEGFPLGPTRSVTQLSGLGYGGGGGGYFRGGS